MQVYADVLFVMNYIMDFFCLYIVRRVMHLKRANGRCALAALMGAVYGMISVLAWLPEPVCMVVVSLGMCAVSVWNGKTLTFIKGIVLFYGISFLLGGIFTLLYEKAYALRDRAFFREGLTLPMFLGLAAVVFILLCAGERVFRTSHAVRSAQVRVRLGEKAQTFQLLCDSGNLLRDPYSGKYVIVVSAEGLDRLLGKEGFHRQVLFHTDQAIAYGFHYIPIRTPAGEGVLSVFCPDEVTRVLPHGDTRMEALIAVDMNTYGEYDGILPEALIEA